jgi:nucleoid DNA-binding protein
MTDKSKLDHQVAVELGKKKSDVSAVTYMFLQKIMDALAGDGEVVLTRLGKLHVVKHEGRLPFQKKTAKPYYLKVHFLQSATLRRAIQKGRTHGEVRRRRNHER